MQLDCNYKGPISIETGSPGFDLSEGKARLFALACQELRKVLSRI